MGTKPEELPAPQKGQRCALRFNPIDPVTSEIQPLVSVLARVTATHDDPDVLDLSVDSNEAAKASVEAFELGSVPRMRGGSTGFPSWRPISPLRVGTADDDA